MSTVRPGSWSLRTRLTALFAAVFSIAGLAVVLVSYVVVDDSLDQPLPSVAAFGDRIPVTGQVTQDVVDRIVAELERQRSATLTSLIIQSTVALVASIALATLVGWLLAGRALRPLEQITDTARQVSDTSLHQRVSLTEGPTEVRDLADSVDAMLARLDQSFDSQSRFVANASHELRTPLAVQRTLLEVEAGDPDASADLKRVSGLLLTINERHERLVDDLLTMTRGEKPVTETDRVDLADLVQHALAVIPHGGVTVSTELLPARTVGSAGLLDRLVVNLIGNAVQHNESGGWVQVTTVTADSADGDSTGLVGSRTPGTDVPAGLRAILTVSNSGPVVAEHEVAGLLQPFSRGRDRVGQGHGLGLSIAAAVVKSHRGELDITPRAEGGLAITVRLPAAT